MKILLVCEFFPQDDRLNFTGGVEAYNYYLAKSLALKNEVTVICRRTNNQKNQVSKSQLKVLPAGNIASRIDTSITTFPSRLSFCLGAIKIGLSQDFDVVQGNNFVTYPVAFLIGLIKKKPKIAWYPDVFVGRWFKLTSFFSGLIGEIAERIYLSLPWDHYISLSKSTKTKLLRAQIDSTKITTIYAGIDTYFLKKAVGHKYEEFTICCICRLVNYKRVDLLIKALSILARKQYDLKLNIVGDGPEKLTLQNLAKKLKIEKRIKWESNLDRNELGSRLKSADLFCLASEQEGFGMVVMEAAAAGVPYVISDIAVFREITKGGKGGYLFKKGDEKELANKIEKIIINPLLKQKLATEAFKISKQYSWDKIAQEFEKVYVQTTK